MYYTNISHILYTYTFFICIRGGDCNASSGLASEPKPCEGKNHTYGMGFRYFIR